MAAQPIVHIDFPATNPVESGAFYAKVFAWPVEAPPGYADYPMFLSKSGPSGGFVPVSYANEGMQFNVGEPLVYIGSEDIDADLQRVQANGGDIILTKREIPHVGWWAVFKDPGGNRVGLFTGAPH